MKKKIETSEDFDCVAFKREAQERIFRDIRDMTSAQEIEYLTERATEGRLGDWWKQVKAGGKKPTVPKRARRSA